MIEAALDVFAPDLTRLDSWIHREVLRLRTRYQLSLDEFRGLYITDDRVDALVRPHLQSSAGPYEAGISARPEAGGDSRWHQLARALDLTDDDRNVLLVCLAPELDPKYETLYAYLNDDVTRRFATLELAARLVARDTGHRLSLRSVGLPGGRLTACGAIETLPTQRDMPVGSRGMRVAPPLVNWLLGLPYIDERLSGISRCITSHTLLPAAALPGSAGAELVRAAHRLSVSARVPPLVLMAPTAPEARLMAEHVFASAARQPILVDLDALRNLPSSSDLAPAVELAQRVLGVGILVSPLDAAFEADGRILENVAAFLRRVARSPALILAGGAGVRWVDLLPDAPVVEIRIPELTPMERAAMWEWALDGHAAASSPSRDALVLALADRYTLGSDRIVKAARLARDSASLAGRGAPSREDLFAAARAVSFHGSDDTTRRVETPFRWEDLILPVDAKQRLADIVHSIELRTRVLDEWGFAKSLGGVRGIKILFAGPSGTGKTMAAGIIANALGLELQRVELGATVSKYIGETEKNLDRAFAAARRANAILFIDEADALFGRRSEVKDAHDRYANVEIAYLLQKMEDHDGVVILATNLAKNIDEAFSRRMQFVIEFPLPDVASRERLWRGMFPTNAPVAGAIDFPFLARQFELTGGDIRNIVLDAAYGAAQEGDAVTLRHLLRAIARQYAKSGRVPTAAEFREHYELLLQAESSASEAT